MATRKSLHYMFILAGIIALSGQRAFGAQEYGPSSEPTVVAPSGLTQREQNELDRQYTFQVRRKDTLLTPYATTPSAYGGAAPAEETAGEQYHRYLGTAIDLYKAGQFEESEKILQYLSDIDPGDDYVKSYLARVQREMHSQKSRWKDKAASEAAAMKRQKLDSLIRDGMDSYKNGDYDSALVSFQDALGIDPKNSTAIAYMPKLKAHYSAKAQADRIVTDWKAKGASSPLERAADTMLERTGGAAAGPAGKPLTDADMRKMAFDRKVDDMLGSVEFGSQVDAIVAAKRADEARSNQMVLGPGDVLKLSVLNHSELSGEISVQSTGMVILPLTGDAVRANGLTIDELKKSVAQVLDKYVQSPNVNISAISYKSQMFYVLDDVSCTPYPITRSDFTLRDALFISDWGNNRALGRVIVMKPSSLHPVVKKVDAFNLIYRGDLSGNVKISSGDVIYIPMTVAAKVTKTVYDTLAPFRALRSARDEYLNTKWNKWDYDDYFRMPENEEDMSTFATSGGGGGFGGGYGGDYGGYGGGGGY